jgi:WD40 repeat protein
MQILGYKSRTGALNLVRTGSEGLPGRLLGKAFSPDGKTVVSSSGDTMSVRLWHSEQLRVRYRARRAAEALRPESERLVDGLFRDKTDLDAVPADLRADQSLSKAQTNAAFRAVLGWSAIASKQNPAATE